MGKATAIEWCDATFNPWWGCNKVSSGCQNCYAETFAKRVGQKIWGPPRSTERRLFGPKHWGEPLKWNAAAEVAGERRRVFCSSMADVFEFNPVLDPERLKLWELIDRTPWLDWLLLTKRPQLILKMVPEQWRSGFPPNVWLGTSVEDQERADLRIPWLLKVPAVVRFLSAEPLLGPVQLRWLDLFPDAQPTGNFRTGPAGKRQFQLKVKKGDCLLHWVIVGGESGPRYRPLDLDWARSLRDQCQAAGVAYFFKQVGGLHHAAGGRLLDGREWSEFPTTREAVRA